MARYNEILAGRYNRFLQKFLSMKGGPPAPQLASELMAVWPLFHGAENRYLENWDLFGCFFNPSAIAAQNSAVRLRNPAGSNIVVVVQKLGFATSLADTLGVLLENGVNTDLGAILTSTRLDNRSQRAKSAMVVSQGNNVAGFLFFDTYPTLANTRVEVLITDIQEFPLLPGDGIQIRTQVVNTNMVGGIWWRERPLEESERF